MDDDLTKYIKPVMHKPIHIISVLPTLDPEFPTLITFRRSGEEAQVFCGPEAAGTCVMYHPNGNVVAYALTLDIQYAIHEMRKGRETARRAARFAALAELCRGFQ